MWFVILFTLRVFIAAVNIEAIVIVVALVAGVIISIVVFVSFFALQLPRGCVWSEQNPWPVAHLCVCGVLRVCVKLKKFRLL